MTIAATINRVKQINYISLEFTVLLAVVALTIFAVATRSVLIVGDTLYASVIFSGISFLLGLSFLKSQKVGKERIFLALTSTVSGIWLYELVYHYCYLDYAKNSLNTTLSYFYSDLRFLTFNTDGRQFPLFWAIIMIALPLAGYKYMQVNKPFVVTSTLSLILCLVWVEVGYPQFMNPQSWPIMTPNWFLISPSHAFTNSPIIVFWGYFFNSITKILTIVPSLLFYRQKKVSAESDVTT